jgi:hypothetical protein
VLDERGGGGELSEESKDVSLSNAHVPELPGHLRSALLLLTDLVDHQHEPSVRAESRSGKDYLLEFLPPKT